MKIFNWVQSKLHQNVIKADGLGKNVKKVESSEIGKNTKAIFEQVGLVDVLENWVDGVLTIGTFGFDTLKCSDDKQNGYSFADDEEKNGSYKKESEDDLRNVAVAGDNYYDEILAETDHVHDDHNEELDPLISDKVFDYDQTVVEDPDDVITAVDWVDDLAPTVEVVDQIHGQKRRTTLAELFMADTDDDYIDFRKSSLSSLSLEIESDYDKYYKLHRSKRRVSFAKKIMSRGKDEDSRPIKKIHQMMKRMLKRKIHPDVVDVGKLFKSEGSQDKPTKENEAVESIHLLNLPDPMV